MKVTELQYYMEPFLIRKLDLMIEQCVSKRVKGDALLLIEGDPGTGKTGMSIAVAKYFSYKTGRKFDNSNIYFDVKKLIEDAQKTENGIFIWDEPALTGMSSDWWNTAQKDLIMLLMLVRKKRHFFIFNITKFTKFQEYIIVDRPIGMIHVYKRNQVEPGRFVYYKKNSLEALYYYWKKTRYKAYKKFYNFRGTFPWILDKVIDEDAYEKEKDKAIESIGGSRKMSKKERKEILLMYRIAMLPGVSLKYKSEHFKVPDSTISEWAKLPEKHPEIDFTATLRTLNVIRGQKLSDSDIQYI